MNQILKQLEKRRGELTTSERQIGAWLEQHPNAVAFSTAGRLATATDVSEATIVRFARKLGFANYSAMQAALRDELEEAPQLESHLRRSIATSDLGAALSQTLAQDLENLQRTYMNIDPQVFMRCVRRLAGARRVGVLGMRASAAPAFYLGFALNLVRPDVHQLRFDVDNVQDQLIDYCHEDVLFAVSVARPSRRTLQVLEVAKQQRNLPIVAVTNSNLSPVAELADESLVAFAEGKFYNYTAIMSLCHALLEGVADLLKDSAQERLSLLEKLNRSRAPTS